MPWEEKQKEDKKRYEQEMEAYREQVKNMPPEERAGGKGTACCRVYSTTSTIEFTTHIIFILVRCVCECRESQEGKVSWRE